MHVLYAELKSYIRGSWMGRWRHGAVAEATVLTAELNSLTYTPGSRGMRCIVPT